MTELVTGMLLTRATRGLVMACLFASFGVATGQPKEDKPENADVAFSNPHLRGSWSRVTQRRRLHQAVQTDVYSLAFQRPPILRSPYRTLKYSPGPQILVIGVSFKNQQRNPAKI